MMDARYDEQKNPKPMQDIAHDIAYSVEQFSADDLLALRSDLLQTNVDSFQAAEIVTAFLSGRGYGVSKSEAHDLATFAEAPGVTVERLQAELERVARAA